MTHVIPGGRDAMLTFYQNRIDLWSSNAADIGLAPETVLALKDSLDAALAQLALAQQTRDLAKTETGVLNAMAAATRALGGAAMATIRAYAESTGDEKVFQKANIPPPKPPQPAGPPSPAQNLVADPHPNGTIELKWKGTVAQNASFDIERSVDGGSYVFIRNTRDKAWIDEAVPMNSAFITYRIYGVRDGKRSVSVSATVQFGTLPAALQAAFRSTGPQAEAA